MEATPANKCFALDGHAHFALTAWGYEAMPSKLSEDHLVEVHSLSSAVSKDDLQSCERLHLLSILSRVMFFLSAPGGPSGGLVHCIEMVEKEAQGAPLDWDWKGGLNFTCWLVGEDALGATQGSGPSISERRLRKLIRAFATLVSFISGTLLPKPEWVPEGLDLVIAELQAQIAEFLRPDTGEEVSEDDKSIPDSMESVDEPDRASHIEAAASRDLAAAGSGGGAVVFSPPRRRPRLLPTPRQPEVMEGQPEMVQNGIFAYRLPLFPTPRPPEVVEGQPEVVEGQPEVVDGQPCTFGSHLSAQNGVRQATIFETGPTAPPRERPCPPPYNADTCPITRRGEEIFRTPIFGFDGSVGGRHIAAPRPRGLVPMMGNTVAPKDGDVASSTMAQPRAPRAPWNDEEERRLISGHGRYGDFWEEIRMSCHLQHRSVSQLRDKWRNLLKYQRVSVPLDRRHGPFISVPGMVPPTSPQGTAPPGMQPSMVPPAAEGEATADRRGVDQERASEAMASDAGFVVSQAQMLKQVKHQASSALQSVSRSAAPSAPRPRPSSSAVTGGGPEVIGGGPEVSDHIKPPQKRRCT